MSAKQRIKRKTWLSANGFYNPLTLQRYGVKNVKNCDKINLYKI